MPTLRLWITGKVQGVGYRAFAVAEAEKREISGWVRNRRDGSVETVAEGTKEALVAFVKALKQGPDLAVVDNIEVHQTDEPVIGGRFVQEKTC